MRNELEITRRQVIALAAVMGAGTRIGLGNQTSPAASVTAGEFLGNDNDWARQVRELHMQLYLFNLEIVPRFVDGRSAVPTHDRKRAELFRVITLYLRRQLNCYDVDLDAAKLHARLEKLYVRSSLDCSRFNHDFVQHPAMAFLRDRNGAAGHAFASLAWGCTPDEHMLDAAAEICLYLEVAADGMEAFDAIRTHPVDDLTASFAVMDRGDYMELVEALFMIRPDAPASLLALHSRPDDAHYGFRNVISNVCGNVMERLANNYFHQTLEIAKLPQDSSPCNGSWHGFIAGQVFDILMQKWLWLMGGQLSGEPIGLEEAGDLSLAVKRGLVDGMLHASSQRSNPPTRS